MSRVYRPLTAAEIALLESQSCTAAVWSMVEVTPEFTPQYVRYAHFSGKVRLGTFDQWVTLAGGIARHTGIYHAAIHNCTIGDNVFIEHVNNCIANYNIGDYCTLQNVNRLVVEGECSFGNGTRVAVLNEVGGREVPIYNKLAAQLAYIIAFYRHRPATIERIEQFIGEYVEEVTSTQGSIGCHTSIINCDTITGVCIGSHCTISGALRLENGTIASCEKAPTLVGHGVIASHFIISTAAKVQNGAVLERCFVGQACHISNHFTAHDSLLFANSHLENGEACAIFAAPYTVSMHKSTLLIGGYFSFLNAGSASNQSNHMYKLGATQQGVLLRGCKLASNSYLSWPCHIGAFSLIMGAHSSHPDTSQLPFSYLIEQQQQSLLIPAVAIKSIGTLRDAQKWPKRDGRTDSEVLDRITTNPFTPYTIQRMISGITLLKELVNGNQAEPYHYQGTVIKRNAALRAIELYTHIVNRYLGDLLLKKLEGSAPESCDELQKRLKPRYPHDYTQWVDLAGLITPQEEVEEVLDSIDSNNIASLYVVEECLAMLHRDFAMMEWCWAYPLLQQWNNGGDIALAIERWRDSSATLNQFLLEDIAKEFSHLSKIGFGLDGDEDRRNRDFDEVRGVLDNHDLVHQLTNLMEQNRVMANKWLERLKAITE